MTGYDVDQRVESLMKTFGTDPIKGLTTAQVEKNRQEYGENRLTPPEKDSIWKQWLNTFKDPTIIILCVCAAIAILVGIIEGNIPWDGVAILVAVSLATAGSTWSEYKADKAFELLKKDTDSIPVKVTRNGQFRTIANNDLVVGDLIHIEGGDKIPADAVLVNSVDLKIDQSLWNGETESAHKGPGDPELIGGTYAVTGNGLALVTAVGDNSKLGILASSLGTSYICPNEEHKKRYRSERICEVPGCGKELEETGKVYKCPNPEHPRVYPQHGVCEVPGCGEELEKLEGTPLQKRLAGLADLISVWGTIAAVLIFIALITSKVIALVAHRVPIGESDPLHGVEGWWSALQSPHVWPLIVFAVLGALGLKVLSIENKKLWMTLWTICVAGVGFVAWESGGHVAVTTVLRFFMVAVTIIVVAVPEGLPMAIFIALGLGMRKIREDNNLVRKMVAAETIGSATVICTDKTGTLTQNQMAVTDVFFRGKHIKNQEVFSLKGTPGFDLLSIACAANSTAEVEHQNGQVRFIGNRTEGALLVWLEKQGVNYQEIRSRMPVHSRVCFNADRKMMTSMTGNNTCSKCGACPLEDVGVDVSSIFTQSDGCRMSFTKGAPEKVLPLCTHVYVDENTRTPIVERIKEIESTVKGMAEQAIRPLAICYRIYGREEAPSGEHAALESEKNMTLLAIVGMTDPVRDDVPEAIRACGQAGIDVKIFTGDHPLTAHAVAERIGMLQKDDIELTGDEFAAKSNEEIKKILPRLRIISRAEPVRDKERLVRLLQEQEGQVVAVTGDGTNDAPALKRADVGISMGLKGTEVAKEASDIVLTDDNFGSIVRAVHWGRTLYENLQKFLQFQLTINLSALGIALISPIMATLFPHSGFTIQPLTVLQYLWINLIMDTLAAIAFGLEPPRPEAMLQPPKNPKDPFLTKTMLSNILVLGSYFIVLILAIQSTDILGLERFRPGIGASEEQIAHFKLIRDSVVFNCYIWFSIFHMINARSVMEGKSAFANITRSRSFFVIMGFVIIMQIALVQFGGEALNTTPLPLTVWFRIILLGATTVIVGEILRLVQRVKAGSYGTPVTMKVV
ncbi:MAG: cation-translocating P-type ATPase [bacterium]